MHYALKSKSEILIRAIKKPKVILGVAASDAHVVANHLIAMYLREHGFEVINLGVCTPLIDFVKAWQENQDCVAIVIGSLNGHAREDLQDLAQFKQEYQIRCPIILGGNLSVGANKSGNEIPILQEMGVDVVLKDVEELLPLLRSILPTAHFPSINLLALEQAS